MLLLDLALPDVDGMDLLSDLRSRYPALPVLVLSMHEESVYAARALRAGASGYVMKHSSARAIVEAIWTVLRGGSAFGAAVSVTKPFLAASRKRRKGSPPQQGVEALSDRELDPIRKGVERGIVRGWDWLAADRKSGFCLGRRGIGSVLSALGGATPFSGPHPGAAPPFEGTPRRGFPVPGSRAVVPSGLRRLPPQAANGSSSRLFLRRMDRQQL